MADPLLVENENENAETPSRRTVHRELRAVNDMLFILEGLHDKARARVLYYLCDFVGMIASSTVRPAA